MSNKDENNSKVIIYTTPWCAFCHTEMKWLDKIGVSYIKKDVEASDEAMQELKSKNGGNFQGVPVTDINGDIILGFDREKIQEALERHQLIPTNV